MAAEILGTVRYPRTTDSHLFHGKRHPAEMGAAEVTRFLSSLAIEGRVAASTQK